MLCDAALLLDAYCEGQPSLASPLLNFCRFLTATCARDAAPLFKLLSDKYAASLARDPALGSYVARIGELYFGIKPAPARGMGGIFGNLMKDLMAG